MSFPETVHLFPGEIVRSGTTQVLPLGTRGAITDGRIYRYCKAGGSITPGMMVQCELPGIQFSCPETSFCGPWLCTYNVTFSTTWQSFEVRMSAPLAAAALAKDVYKEGYIFISSSAHSAGSGQMWMIKTQSALTASSTQPCVFTIGDGEYPETIPTTMTGFAVGVLKNQYKDVIQVVVGAEPTSVVLGICPCTVASGDYFWVQTWGRCVAAYGTAATVRAPLIPSTGAMTGVGVGSITGAGVGLVVNQVLGYAPAVTLVGAYAAIDLQISP